MKSVKIVAFGFIAFALTSHADVAVNVDVAHNGIKYENVRATQATVINETETEALVTFEVFKEDEKGISVLSQPEVLVNLDGSTSHLSLASADQTLDIAVTAEKTVAA